MFIYLHDYSMVNMEYDLVLEVSGCYGDAWLSWWSLVAMEENIWAKHSQWSTSVNVSKQFYNAQLFTYMY